MDPELLPESGSGFFPDPAKCERAEKNGEFWTICSVGQSLGLYYEIENGK